MYLFSYFTAIDEALHLAISRDGQSFTPLGGGPLLRSGVGAQSMRDPFIGRDPRGVFHLLATDGWVSDSIVYSSSVDLIAWTEPELVPLMAGVPEARNTWAPEWFVQPDGSFRVIWSSVCEPGGEPDFSDLSQPQTIWSAVTTDFAAFGPSASFYSPGFSVIDASMQRAGDRYVMCFKDERESREDAAPTKTLYSTVWDPSTGAFTEPHGPISPPRVEGPAWLRRGDELVIAYDYFMDGEYGASATRDLGTWTRSSISVPAGARHGAFLEISDDEAGALELAYGVAAAR